MDYILQYSIIGLVIICSIVGWNHTRIWFFKLKKEDRYRDSVGATRLNRDLTGRGHKK